MLVLLLALGVDGVDGDVGAIRGIDGVVEGVFAAAIHAVREDDDCLAAFLVLHQFVAGQKDCVVELAGIAGTCGALAVVARGLRTFGVVVTFARCAQVIEFLVNLVARGREVFEELDLAVEVDEEGLVGMAGARLGGDHRIDELGRCFAYLFEGGSDRVACLDQQADFVGLVCVAAEGLDGLRAAVFSEGEVVLVEGWERGRPFCRGR